MRYYLATKVGETAYHLEQVNPGSTQAQAIEEYRARMQSVHHQECHLVEIHVVAGVASRKVQVELNVAAGDLVL